MVIAIIQGWVGEHIGTIISYILGSGGILAYFFERRKRSIDLKQQDASALQTMQEAYDKFTSDSLTRYEDLKKDHEKLKEQVSTVSERLELTLKELKDEKELNSTHTTEMEQLKKAYEKLYKDYNICQENLSD